MGKEEGEEGGLCLCECVCVGMSLVVQLVVVLLLRGGGGGGGGWWEGLCGGCEEACKWLCVGMARKGLGIDS
jgi:hypothetical protein